MLLLITDLWILSSDPYSLSGRILSSKVFTATLNFLSNSIIKVLFCKRLNIFLLKHVFKTKGVEQLVIFFGHVY